MTQRYGPWIEHDGKGYPHAIFAEAYNNGSRRYERCFLVGSGTRTNTPWEQAHPPETDKSSPAWTWVWRGGIFTPRRRVCVDPEYRPLIKYRFVYEDPPAVSDQVEMLRDIASGKREPAPEPVSKEAVRND